MQEGTTEPDRSASSTIGRKVRPPAASGPVLARPRVTDLLRALLDRGRVLVVAAAAGSGKTTAVLSATTATGSRPAWLTVDAPDAAPGRLLAYLESALAVRVGRVAGLATGALAAGLSHREAAGLLADALGDEPVILVLDDLERLGDAAESWSVLSAFLRHAPPTMRTVMVSRRSLPAALELPPPPETVWLDERELCFTTAEATEALALRGRGSVDAARAVEVTGGWVMGVLFEAWGSAAHVPGAGGEVDPLFGYLGAHILDQLDPASRDFLVRTALLDEVSAERATALGIRDAGALLARLRAAHLPVSWEDAGAPAMRCHARFREFLLALLARRGDAELAELRRAHGRLLADEGHPEEAVEELLACGAVDEAAPLVEQAILTVVERLDLPQARRWLAVGSGQGPSRPTALGVAELMICWAEEDYRGTERVADELVVAGELAPLVRRSSRAAALVAWCYYMRGRRGDAEAILAAAGGPEVESVRYLVADSDGSPPRPQPSGGPFDLFVLFADYFAGRFRAVEKPPGSRWASSVIETWRIAVLRATGRTRQALEAYRRAVADSSGPQGMLAFVAPEIHIDAGDQPRARAAIAAAKERYERIGAHGWAASVALTEARLELRLARDPTAARTTLDAVDAGIYVGGGLFRAAYDVWYGFAELLEGEDAAALARLRRTVAFMRESRGHIELPAAAVYLAEAEWRAGEEDAADGAADAALEAATGQGSNHLILQALGDFPAVLSRRLDAEPGTDSAWHGLGRALISRGVQVPGFAEHSVLLREFGAPRIEVDGEPLRVSLSKSLELLAYLVSRPSRAATRGELLTALFGGRDDDSTRSYLRQVVHRLRAALPEETLLSDRDRIAIGQRVAVESESSRLLAALAEANRLRGGERLQAVLDAVGPTAAGVYLDGLDAAWLGPRRDELETALLQARGDAAQLAFEAGDYRLAEELATGILETDPGRENAWRLRILIAQALGDGDAAVDAYRRCRAALAELGVAPGAATDELVSARSAPRG